jgi:hypothetical protein
MNANEASREQKKRSQKAAKLFADYVAAKKYSADVSGTIQVHVDSGYLSLEFIVSETETSFTRTHYFPEKHYHGLSPSQKAELTSAIKEYLTESGYYIAKGYFHHTHEEHELLKYLRLDEDSTYIHWGASAAFIKSEDEKAAAAEVERQKVNATGAAAPKQENAKIELKTGPTAPSEAITLTSLKGTIILKHPKAGIQKKLTVHTAGTYMILFGPFYLMYHGVWLHGIISLAVSLAAPGAWIIWCFFCKKLILNKYLKEGYEVVAHYPDGKEPKQQA